MPVETECSPEGARVTASGRLTVSGAGALHRALLEALAAGGRVELALRDVGEADLSLLQLVCAARRSADECGTPFVVTGIGGEGPVRGLIERSGATRCEGCPGGCPWASAAAEHVR